MPGQVPNPELKLDLFSLISSVKLVKIEMALQKSGDDFDFIVKYRKLTLFYH